MTRIYEKSSTGTGTETVLPSGDVSSIPVNWSADGKYIVFSRLRQAGNTSSYDTWLLPTFGDRKPAPLLETGFDKFQARVSPNSNFVAYPPTNPARTRSSCRHSPMPAAASGRSARMVESSRSGGATVASCIT